MMKRQRHEKILALIRTNEIETQDELITKLREQGISVTQATASRDIRELNLSKAPASSGRYCYSEPSRTGLLGDIRFSNTFAEAIISIVPSANIVVVKTYPGMASPVAVSIDSMKLPEILGCVAGDDTIIMVTRDNAATEKISAHLEELIRENCGK